VFAGDVRDDFLTNQRVDILPPGANSDEDDPAGATRLISKSHLGIHMNDVVICTVSINAAKIENGNLKVSLNNYI
jgi:hypothetical protein